MIHACLGSFFCIRCKTGYSIPGMLNSCTPKKWTLSFLGRTVSLIVQIRVRKNASKAIEQDMKPINRMILDQRRLTHLQQGTMVVILQLAVALDATYLL